MSLYSYKNIKPEIADGCFVADNAIVVGKVQMKKDANIWFGVVARGDENVIQIGEGTNIQDLTMLHVTQEHPLIIGNGVTVGHNVILHGCIIEDNALIGMGAIVLDGAVVGKNSVVAAGAVVPPGKIYPEGSMIMGNPAKVVRPLRPEELRGYGQHYKSYIETKNEYLRGDVKLITEDQ